MRKCLSLLLVLCALFGLAAISVSAIEPIKTDAKVSLNLTYSYNDSAFEGLDVSIYRVAEVDSDTVFRLCGGFEKYALAVNTVKSQEEWKQIAQTAMSYVVADSVGATASAVTDADGKVSFEEIDTGLYLVSPCRVDYDKGYLAFDSFMMILPSANDDGTWNYAVDARPKSLYVQTRPDDVEYSVVKLWKDTGFESARPSSVKIEIYKDGAFVEEITLSADNNWKYSWTAADDGAVWTVAEKDVARGYTVLVESKDKAFVISNTYSKTPPPPATGDSFNMAFYVILLAIAGLGLVIIGTASYRRG